MIRAAILALFVLPLAACGFAPVYGSGASAANAGPIDILEIQGRSGHFLRQELVRTIGQGAPGIIGPAQLEIVLGQSIERLAFKPDQAASRSDYVGTATWTLRTPAGVTLQTGAASERASFNFADSAYADLAAQTAAQERLATLLARSIRDQIIMTAGKPLDKAAIPAATTAATPGAPTPPRPLLPTTQFPGGQ
jgi:LPS-assembly lipoprotein